MKRYDVCPANGQRAAGKSRLVVVLQHEHVSDLATVIVAPLFPEAELPIVANVRIKVDIDRKAYVAAVDRLAALPKKQLKRPVASLEQHSVAFIKAVDVLFSGF